MSCARRKAEPSSSPQLPTSLQLRLRRVQARRSIILGLHDPGILPRGPVYMFESHALFVHTKGFLAGSDCDLICPRPNAFVSVGGRGPAPHNVDPEGKGRGTDDSRRPLYTTAIIACSQLCRLTWPAFSASTSASTLED